MPNKTKWEFINQILEKDFDEVKKLGQKAKPKQYDYQVVHQLIINNKKKK
jgi:hypothetical protein